MNYETLFLKALSITILIEATVLLLILKFILKRDHYSTQVLLLSGILPTMATLPYLWFIFPMFLKTKMSYIIISELSAVGAEIFIIKGLLRSNLSKAFILSLACNTSSYLIGLILF